MAAASRGEKPMRKAMMATAAGVFLALAAAGPTKSANGFDFNEYRVPKTYSGKLQLPDFKGRDSAFADFKTRIKDAMKAGVTFAAEFSVMQAGCGAGCSFVVVANNRTGKLYRFPRGGEYNQALTLQFTPDSNLMLVRWATDPSWQSCVFESLVFDNGKWIAKDALAGQGDEVCDGDVVQGVRKARGF